MLYLLFQEYQGNGQGRKYPVILGENDTLLEQLSLISDGVLPDFEKKLLFGMLYLLFQEYQGNGQGRKYPVILGENDTLLEQLSLISDGVLPDFEKKLLLGHALFTISGVSGKWPRQTVFLFFLRKKMCF